MWWNATREFSLSGTVCDGYVIDVYDGTGLWLVMPFYDHYFKWNCVLKRAEIPSYVIRDNVHIEGKSFVTSMLKELILHKMVKVVCGEFDSRGRVTASVFFEEEDVSDYLNRVVELPV